MIEFFIFCKKILQTLPRVILHPLIVLRLFRVYSTPRFCIKKTRVLGEITWFVDCLSFLHMYGEIFERSIYKFNSLKKSPYIIDCGANIGLSVLYFKKLFPSAEILAFEPDPKIFSVLQKNITEHKLNDVTVLPFGLAAHEGEMSFKPDGADGGRIVCTNGGQKIVTMRLGSYMTKEVDFLKIDIEGSEGEVLKDIQENLHLVKNIFIEYHSFVDRSQILSEILAILSDSGFRYYIERVGRLVPEPFMFHDNTFDMDLQLNIFGYRV